jgi:hypothetical protein
MQGPRLVTSEGSAGRVLVRVITLDLSATTAASFGD